MLRRTVVLLLAFLTLVSFSKRTFASAAGQTEVGIQAGGVFFEGDDIVDEDGVYGARIGHYLTNNLSFEIAGLFGKTELHVPSSRSYKADVFIPTAELQYHFGESSLKPFVALGAGMIDIDYDRAIGDNDRDLAVQYGGGLKWQFAKSLLARLDARHLINTENGLRTHNATLTAGLSWLIGDDSEPVKKVVSAPAPKPIDSDNDGVTDDKDACPATPAGTKVGANGCEIDSDQDGVVDSSDKCPGTAAGFHVDANGCTVDSDADGVTDDKDNCPNTPAGTAVRADGCPQAVKEVPQAEWVLSGVQFESGSDSLTSGSKAVLDDAVKTLSSYSKVRVEIQGHTDNTGSATLNAALSEKRANAVKSYLVTKGILAERLESKGYGDSKPIADNKTKDGRFKNRRIEFKVLSR